MSDDDFMLESDNEDYEFDYEDNSEEESPDVDIENRYYNAKQMKATDPEAAINEFLGVVMSEEEKGDWCVLLLRKFDGTNRSLQGFQRTEASNQTRVQTEAT